MSAKLISFLVMVPVLSTQRMSIPESSSIASSFATIAPPSARARAPTSIATDKTAGIAMGMDATSNISANCTASRVFWPLINTTASIIETRATAKTIK
ncbi:Uncharacterised protein [uncultured archaeon]|nr:Uncharacterised protein [uncultured archaeon]